MSAIDELRAEVEEAKTVSASAIALIGGLKEKLDAAVASGDMSQVEALVADLDANNKQLADAVTANTPSDPAAPSATGGPSTQPDPSTPPDPNA